MSANDSDLAEWARTHRACFQLEPLLELHKGEKVQVGFTLSLYAALPMDRPAGQERREAAADIAGKLRAVLESLTPAEGSGAGFEISAPGPVVLRPENELKPEVGVTARIFHRKAYFQPTTADERTRLGELEKHLAALGLRKGHW